MTGTVELCDVQAAALLLRGRVRRTPLLCCDAAPKAHQRLLFKCENLQTTGAFKARGALHFLLQLERAEASRVKGVATYSSGNHGAAVAWAAGEKSLQCMVFVPEDIPIAKERAIRDYGGKVVRAGRTSKDRQLAALEAADKEGLTIVPPFDHPWIVAGQGTVGLEIVEQCEEASIFPDRVLVPVGGGGLLAGIAVAIKSLLPRTQVIGVEPVNAASMAAALKMGEPVEIDLGQTIADGLRPVQVGSLTHRLADGRVDSMMQIEDSAIVSAMRFLFERMKLVVEPSGAAALGACLEQRTGDLEGTTLVVLSGGNIDPGRFLDLVVTGAAERPPG